MAKFDPIKNAVILDIETAGINAGSPIHEISFVSNGYKAWVPISYGAKLCRKATAFYKNYN